MGDAERADGRLGAVADGECEGHPRANPGDEEQDGEPADPFEREGVSRTKGGRTPRERDDLQLRRRAWRLVLRLRAPGSSPPGGELSTHAHLPRPASPLRDDSTVMQPGIPTSCDLADKVAVVIGNRSGYLATYVASSDRVACCLSRRTGRDQARRGRQKGDAARVGRRPLFVSLRSTACRCSSAECAARVRTFRRG